MDFRIVAVFLCVTTGTLVFASFGEEKMLQKTIVSHYANVGKDGLPLLGDIDSIDVKFGLSLQLIHSMEQRGRSSNSIGTFKTLLMLSWVDPFLRWDPKDYNNIEMIGVSPDDIWTPDIKLYNSLDVDMTVDRTAQAVVFSNGTVLWIPPAVLKVLCASDGDADRCEMKFGSWIHNVNQVDMQFMGGQSAALLDFYTDPIEILENSAQRREAVYPCCEAAYVELTYSLALRSENVYNGLRWF